MKVNLAPSSRIIRFLFPVIFFSFIIALFLSAAYGGYHAGFDNDEFQNVHIVYLLASGKRMFADFYSIYSPLFHWLFIPVYTAFGFVWDTLRFTRFLMIGLFALRMTIIFFLTRRLFGLRVGLLFLIFHLLDPFTLATGMQIRPDSLMLTVFCLGLLFLTRSRKSAHGLFAGGVCLGLATLVSIKILPAVLIAAGIAFWWYIVVRKKAGEIVPLLVGTALPVLLFAAYFWVNGVFPEMMRQLLQDAQLTNATRHYPISPGYFYIPGNHLLYGGNGRTILWLFTLLLPLAAAAGAYHTVSDAFLLKLRDGRSLYGAMLALVLAVLWIMIQLVPSVFLQYYLSVTWLYAVFAAVSVARLWFSVLRVKNIRVVLAGLGMVCMVWLVVATHKTNLMRAANNGDAARDYLAMRWNQIPADEPVYPGLLFRPPAYPITVGYFIGEVPLSIRTRFPSIQSYLEKNHVRYAIVDDYGLRFLESSERQYIEARYVAPNPSDPDFRVRTQ